MADFESPFLKIPESAWLCSNDLAFAVFDNFPVSPGHALVITKRIAATWFDATAEEQKAVMDLVNLAKGILDARLKLRPDGYNVGFNAGPSAGQTVPHLHVHVIPRYSGDMADPRGGVRKHQRKTHTSSAREHFTQTQHFDNVRPALAASL